MEHVENGSVSWSFNANDTLQKASTFSVRGVLSILLQGLDSEDDRPVIPFGHGDPSVFPSFRTAQVAEEAIVDALRSGKFNCYAPNVGVLPARRSVADYLSTDLPYKLSPDDVFITIGCTQAIEAALTVLARPGASILLPRPGFPYYEACALHKQLSVRYFDLLPDRGWEVDFAAVEALADENTVAMVIINPGNPCGNVYSYDHLKKVAETARKLGILVIADEVYGHLAFGSTRFVPMGAFASITPVLTLGSISKRWAVPGWRLGWLVACDPHGVLKHCGLLESIKAFLNISSDPATFIQGAIPDILKNTEQEFFSKINRMLMEAANLCYKKLLEIPCITCPNKPEGSMFVMASLDVSFLEDISDDMDFCKKLAKEESVIILPGIALGMKNWLRITFAIELGVLEDGLRRVRAFCERHSKNH